MEQENEVLEEVKSTLDLNELWGRKNVRYSVFGVLGAIILVVGYYMYGEYVVKPAEQKAVEKLYMLEHYLLDNKDYDKAIKGDGKHKGLVYYAKKSGKAGNLAKYYLGIAHYGQKAYEKAVQSLKKVDFENEMLQSKSLALLGDAYMQLGKTKEAKNAYEKASKIDENTLFTPICLEKLGLCYELLNQNDKANKVYADLETRFPNYPNILNIKKKRAMTTVKSS